MDDRPHHPEQAMENRIPFNLNRAIYLWRQRISGSPAVRGKDMDELEDHLRDAIASLELRGLTAQEAFYVAQHRLGASDVLQAEFGKVNRSQVWLDRALWMVLGSLAFSSLASLSHAMASLAELGLFLVRGECEFVPVRMLLYPFSFGLLLLLLWRWGNRPNAAPARVGRWMRSNPVAAAISAVVLLAVLQGMGFGVTILTLRNLPPEQYVLATQWRFSFGIPALLITPVLLGWLLHRTRRQRETASQH